MRTFHFMTTTLCLTALLSACGGDTEQPAAPTHFGTDSSTDTGSGTGGTGSSTDGSSTGGGSSTDGTTSGGGSGSSTGGSSTGSGGTEPPPPTMADLLEPRVVGTYLMQIRVASQMDEPPLGTRKSHVSTTVSVVEVARRGERFVMGERPCRTTTTQGGITIPDALTQSIGLVESELVFEGTSQGARVVRPEAVVVVGARLTNPGTDALPTSGTDARVVDQDGDGKPGVTVKKSGFPSGDIYVVQRQRTSFEATLGPVDGTFDARVISESEQNVVGSTNSILKMNVPTWQDPDLSKSSLRLRRIEGPIDCAGAVSRSDAVFGR